eukprot:GHVP01047713.1.p1 GENE.GHVP01047713.1~~GHVP01047713.1.p1  ORF type:complete len:224 (+),score=63.01 GHVP01047713.1:10-681(+)
MQFEESLNDIKKETQEVQDKFKSFTEDCKKTLFEEKTRFNNEIEEKKRSIEKMKQRKTVLMDKKQEIISILQKEDKEFEKTENQVKRLTEQKIELIEKKENISNEYSLAKERNMKLKEEFEEIARYKETLLNNGMEELRFYRDFLGLTIRKVNENIVDFIFSNINQKDLYKEHKVSLDVKSDPIKIIDCSPYIEGVEKLLDDNSIISFLKKIRKEFVSIYQNK